MQVQITTRHGALSEGTREKIETKVEKLTRLFERLISIGVTIDLERAEEPAVEILVEAEHKHDFVSRSSASELMAALDLAVHKMEAQLRKYKDRIQEHHG